MFALDVVDEFSTMTRLDGLLLCTLPPALSRRTTSRKAAEVFVGIEVLCCSHVGVKFGSTSMSKRISLHTVPVSV